MRAGDVKDWFVVTDWGLLVSACPGTASAIRSNRLWNWGAKT